jgi:hypothetical protein
MCDNWRPFEHEIFVRISQACPLLNKLRIINRSNLYRSSLDYAEQFLFDFKPRLPCLNTLHIKYVDLVILTENFTNNVARTNCSKLQHIIFDSPPMIYPEHVSLYLPFVAF